MNHRARWLAGLLVVLAAGLAANSLLGPLAFDVIEYHYGEAMTNQGIGLDVVALALAAPLALLAARLIAAGGKVRGPLTGRRRAGALLAFPPATFAAYMLPQYVVGPDYLGLPGNNEVAVPFHLGLFVVALAAVVLAWSVTGTAPLPPDRRRSDRRRAAVLVGLAAFTALGRWLPGIVDALRDEPSNAEYLDNPTAFWLIATLDLGLVVPAALAAAVGLWRQARWARRAAYAMIGWFSLVPASVAAMAVTMQVNDDPLASTANTVTMVVAALVFTPLAALLYLPLFRHEQAAPPTSADHAGGLVSWPDLPLPPGAANSASNGVLTGSHRGGR